MKATASILIIVAFAGAACWLLASVNFIEVVESAPPERVPEPRIMALEEAEPEMETIATVMNAAEAPAAEEVVVPVDPIEDRGDAMLFEIDALGGTPFDQAVVMPFD